VDPDSISKDQRFSPQFQVKVHFADVCSKCTHSSMKLEELCRDCRLQMAVDIDEQWNIIKQILDQHDYPKHEDGVLICFRKSVSDFKTVLAKAKESKTQQQQHTALTENAVDMWTDAKQVGGPRGGKAGPKGKHIHDDEEDTDSDEDEEDAQGDKEESKKKSRNDLLEEVKVPIAHQY
jgi:hypothetical protein